MIFKLDLKVGKGERKDKVTRKSRSKANLKAKNVNGIWSYICTVIRNSKSEVTKRNKKKFFVSLLTTPPEKQ